MSIGQGAARVRHQIHIQDTGERFACFEHQHLLQGMLALGKRGIPSGCHGGGCGVCKVRLLSGDRDALRLSMSRAHVSAEEQRQGIGLACRIYPRADIRLRVLGAMRRNLLRPGPAWLGAFNGATEENGQ